MNLKNFFHEAIELLKYYKEASTIYSVHSPSIFHIINSAQQYENLENADKIRYWWKSLKKDNSLLSEKEYGAGSRVKSKSSISKSARTSASSNNKAIFIAKIAAATKAKTIIELGTNLGKTTAYLSIFCPQAKIYTVEADSVLLNKANAYFNYLSLKNIISYPILFERFFKDHKDLIAKADFIFIDGNHTYEATIEYFNIIRNASNTSKCILIDDIHWSPDMSRAWNKIIDSLDQGVSIDFFKTGLIKISESFAERQNFKIINKNLKPFSCGFFN